MKNILVQRRTTAQKKIQFYYSIMFLVIRFRPHFFEFDTKQRGDANGVESDTFQAVVRAFWS